MTTFFEVSTAVVDSDASRDDYLEAANAEVADLIAEFAIALQSGDLEGGSTAVDGLLAVYARLLGKVDFLMQLLAAAEADPGPGEVF